MTYESRRPDRTPAAAEQTFRTEAAQLAAARTPTLAEQTDTLRAVLAYCIKDHRCAVRWQEDFVAPSGRDRIALYYAMGRNVDTATWSRQAVFMAIDIVRQALAQHPPDRDALIRTALDLAAAASGHARDCAVSMREAAAHNLQDEDAADFRRQALLPASAARFESLRFPPAPTGPETNGLTPAGAGLGALLYPLRLAHQYGQQSLHGVLSWEADFDARAYGDCRDRIAVYKAADHNADAAAHAGEAVALMSEIVRRALDRNCPEQDRDAFIHAALELAGAAWMNAKRSAKSLADIGAKNRSDADYERSAGFPRRYRLYPPEPPPAAGAAAGTAPNSH